MKPVATEIPDMLCPDCGKPVVGKKAVSGRMDYWCIHCAAKVEFVRCAWCFRFMERKLHAKGNGFYFHCYHVALGPDGKRLRSPRGKLAFFSTQALVHSPVYGWVAGHPYVKTILTTFVNHNLTPDGKQISLARKVPNLGHQEECRKLVALRLKFGLDRNGEGTPNEEYRRTVEQELSLPREEKAKRFRTWIQGELERVGWKGTEEGRH